MGTGRLVYTKKESPTLNGSEMFKFVNERANFVGVPVTSLGDIPNLIEALEEFGQFHSADLVRAWYATMIGRMHDEYVAYA